MKDVYHPSSRAVLFFSSLFSIRDGKNSSSFKKVFVTLHCHPQVVSRYSTLAIWDVCTYHTTHRHPAPILARFILRSSGCRYKWMPWTML